MTRLRTPKTASGRSPSLVLMTPAIGIAMMVHRAPGSMMVPVSIGERCSAFCKNKGMTKVTMYIAMMVMPSAIKAAV